MKGIRNQPTTLWIALLVLFAVSSTNCSHAQTPVSGEEVAVQLSGQALVSYLNTQLEILESPEFRARELAAWRLRQYPEAAIELIAKSAPSASLNSASLQISLLDHFLSHPNTEIKDSAYDTLKQFSLTQTTALASLAASSVKGIEDEFQHQAFEILTNAGANIGYLDINFSGPKKIFNDDLLGVEIRAGKFTGTQDTLTWIRYLKSVKVVSLEGEFASPETLALVAQMASVKKILLRGKYVRPGVYESKLRPVDLLVLKQLPEIQHLEIRYMSIDDSFVPALCQLPITESLRLFGTAITEQGKEELALQLDDLEIYRGSGGFLGIGSEANGPVLVTLVQENSAAKNAGIERGDIITEIEGNPVKNFTALRAILANYGPNEMVLVKLQRPREGNHEYQLFVVLNEQQN